MTESERHLDEMKVVKYLSTCPSLCLVRTNQISIDDKFILSKSPNSVNNLHRCVTCIGLGETYFASGPQKTGDPFDITLNSVFQMNNSGDDEQGWTILKEKISIFGGGKASIYCDRQLDALIFTNPTNLSIRKPSTSTNSNHSETSSVTDQIKKIADPDIYSKSLSIIRCEDNAFS
jgi:hypothetical protein